MLFVLCWRFWFLFSVIHQLFNFIACFQIYCICKLLFERLKGKRALSLQFEHHSFVCAIIKCQLHSKEKNFAELFSHNFSISSENNQSTTHQPVAQDANASFRSSIFGVVVTLVTITVLFIRIFFLLILYKLTTLFLICFYSVQWHFLVSIYFLFGFFRHFLKHIPFQRHSIWLTSFLNSTNSFIPIWCCVRHFHFVRPADKCLTTVL